jgi:hypothetical protein
MTAVPASSPWRQTTRLVVAGLVTGTVLGFAPVAHAAPAPTGFRCGFSSVTDPTTGNTQVGEVDATLVLTDDTDPARTYTGYVTCTIQTGINDTHAEADAAAVTGISGPGPLAAVAGTVTYAVADHENVYLCTEVVTDGGTVYWDALNEVWSSDPDVGCDNPAYPEPQPDPLPDWDLMICPILAIVFPPEGDVTVPVLGKVWDCPPYDW